MRKITLNESEMTNFVSMIVEQVNLSGYSDEDFLEVFVNLFRPWIKLNHGDEISKHPMSFLVNKYLDDFCNDYGIGTNYLHGNAIRKIMLVGREIVRNGKYDLPSLNSGTKFTERFKKHLDYFISNFNIPDYVKINFTEDSPNKVMCRIIVDFQRLIKSVDDSLDTFSPYSFSKQFREHLENYLGVEFGPATHGKLDLHVNTTPEYIGVDEWIKTEFNKNIKKQVKQLPLSERNISSLKFILRTGSRLGAEIKIGWKRDSRWNDQRLVKESVRELLSNMGYNTDFLEVTST